MGEPREVAMVAVMRADIVVRSALVIFKQSDGISQGRPIDEVKLLGDHAFVGVELPVDKGSQLRGEVPVVLGEFSPAVVTGQSSQLKKAFLHIESVKVEVVILK